MHEPHCMLQAKQGAMENHALLDIQARAGELYIDPMKLV